MSSMQVKPRTIAANSRRHMVASRSLHWSLTSHPTSIGGCRLLTPRPHCPMPSDHQFSAVRLGTTRRIEETGFAGHASMSISGDMQFTPIFTCSGAPRGGSAAFMKAAESTSNRPLELPWGSKGRSEAQERLREGFRDLSRGLPRSSWLQLLQLRTGRRRKNIF